MLRRAARHRRRRARAREDARLLPEAEQAEGRRAMSAAYDVNAPDQQRLKIARAKIWAEDER